MSAKIYVSVPVVLDWNTSVYPAIFKLLENLENAGLGNDVEVDFWIRNTPYVHNMKDYQAVILMTPYNYFKMSYSQLPSGTQSEIKKAVKNSIPVYLCYTPSAINAGNPQFYQTVPSITGLEGIQGSTGHLYNFLSKFKSKEINKSLLENVIDIPAGFGKTVIVETKSSTYDRRLLLLK